MTSELSRRILFVDDDENLLNGIRRQLRRKFEVETAIGPAEGLEAIATRGPFAAVVSDFNMPGMSGVEFLQQLHDRAPDTVRVMLTGRGDTNLVIKALHEGKIFRFLNKPCDGAQLETVLSDCLEQYRLVMTERLLTRDLNHANQQLQELNERLEERVSERTAAIRDIHAFVSELSGLESLDEVAHFVVETTSRMLRSRRVSLMMPDASGEYLTIVAAVGMPSDLIARVRVPVDAAIAGLVFSDVHEIVVNQLDGPTVTRASSPCFHVQDASATAPGDTFAAGRYDDEIFASWPLACAALVTPTQSVGVLNVTGHDGPYDAESIAQLKAIAEAATIAILNQIRREERNEARDATILALAKLAEHRDPETGAHLERVQNYCRLLSQALGATPQYAGIIDGKFIDSIVRSSPLHDIGKVGIPDRVLLKPGRLTPEEFEIMKRHVLIGGDTLRSLVEKGRHQTFLQMGMDIAYSHHEQFDGGGYPRGLAGQEIPLAARILSLADVYDALTSKRVYKEAMTHEQAAEIIRGEAGTHFDPDVVDAFWQNQEAFKQLAAEMADAHGRGPDHDAMLTLATSHNLNN